MNILDFNKCELNCDCGWNIQLGGGEKELKKLKKALKGLVDDDLTDYDEKIGNYQFIKE